MKVKNVLKTIVKAFLSVIVFEVIGVISSVWYGLHYWVPERASELELGWGMLFEFLSLIIVSIILFGILGIILGGITGMIFFLVVKLVKDLKK